MPIEFNAAVFNGTDRPLEIERLTLSETPGPREVLVKLAASGTCHSDLHVLKGEWESPAPMVLGHEGAGEVVAVGRDVKTLSEGDHVVISWTPACGACEFCVVGRPVLCQLANETAYKHVYFDGKTRLLRNAEPVKSFLAVGSFGEYAMVSESGAIKIRKDAPLKQASLVGCAVTTGIGAVVNTANMSAGDTALVVGCGGVGLNIIQGSRLAGARQIIAADTSEEKLALARKLGATHTINVRESDMNEAVLEFTRGRGVDYAFEAIGLAKTIEAAHGCTARGGTTVIVGQVADGVRISVDPFVISDQEKRIIGSNYGSCRTSVDFPRIIDLYMEGLVDLDSLITDSVPLAEINTAFDRMRRGEGIRTVVEYA